MQINRSRRDFLATLSAAGATSIVGARKLLADEAPPEVTTVRLVKQLGVCMAPQEIAEDLLRAEGFTDVQLCTAAFCAGEADRPGGRGHRA